MLKSSRQEGNSLWFILIQIFELKVVSSQGAYQRCDVLNWDDQVALFELAVSRFGSVDIVVSSSNALSIKHFVTNLRCYSQIPNAGISEAGASLGDLKIVDGKPKEPVFKTLQINLIAVMYSQYNSFCQLFQV